LKNSRLKILTHAGIFISLALLLEYLTIFIPKMPQGGKFISLGMIPLITFAMIYGWKWGTFAGITFGLSYYLLEPYFIHPVQFILDYPLAFGLVGLAGGIFSKNRGGWCVPVAVLLSCLARFLCHVTSGVIFFKTFAPSGTNVWLYSMLYNGTYIIPTTIACWIIIPPILKRFHLLGKMK
jgi:thiamine transporter